MCTLVIPFIFSPLYSFLPDKYLDEINNTIKSKIMFNYLDKYLCEFKLFSNGSLPEDTLSDIDLLSGTFDFAYGDDLLSGRFNCYNTQISEYHVKNYLFRKVFDGYIAKIQIPNESSFEEFTIIRDDFKKNCKAKNIISNEFSTSNSQAIKQHFDNNKNLVFIKSIKNNLYFGIKGEKNMFEYSFKKIDKNRLRYHKDLISFESLIDSADQLTKLLNSDIK